MKTSVIWHEFIWQVNIVTHEDALDKDLAAGCVSDHWLLFYPVN